MRETPPRLVIKFEDDCLLPGALRGTKGQEILIPKGDVSREGQGSHRMKAQVQSLKEMYSKPNCWEKSSAPLMCFWTDPGKCWAFPFFAVVGTRQIPEQERLLIYFALGTVIIIGMYCRGYK